MSRLAQSAIQKKKYDEQEKKKSEQDAKVASGDTRPLANKIFDTLNIGDSGRSFTTATPTKNTSVKDSVGDITDSLFSGTEKTLDAVQALTGATERKQNKQDAEFNAKMSAITDKYKDVPDGDPRLKKMYAEKKKLTQERQKVLKSDQEDTAWAGTEDKGMGDRLKKAAGVSAQTVSEWIPVGKGAQAGNVARKGVVKAGEEVAAKGAKDVAEQGLSRMAKAKLAAKVAGQQAVVGGVGGAGGAAAEDGADLKDVATQALVGAGSGAILGGGSTYLPDIRAPKDQGGFIKNPFYKAQIGDDLANEIKLGKVHADITEHPAETLKLGSDTVSDPLDRATVDSYKAKLQAGEALDPILVHTGRDGTPYIQDGAHRFQAATELGIKNIPTVEKADNVVMAAKVTPPTEASLTAKVEREPTLTQISDAANKRPDAQIQKEIETAHNAGDTATVEQLIPQLSPDMQAGMRSALGLPAAEPKLQLKVLDDLQREADVRTPGGLKQPASQAVETKTQKGAQFLVDDLDKLQKETGIDVTPLDRQAAAHLTGEVRRSGFQEFKDKMGRNFQDTLTYATRTMGKTGSDFVYDMLQGNKFKRDALTALRDDMSVISKLNKKLTGSSLTAKRDVGARIGKALDDRANVDQYITKPEERQLFDQYVKVFDYVKQLREKSGLEVLENYRPWVNMKEAAEPPTWLAENVTNKRTQTLSRFSKERTRTEVDDKVDNNLADMIYGYVNSQLNEMAYDAPVKRFKGSIDGLSAGNKANVAGMNDGLDYMRTLVEQAVNPARKNPVERAAGKLTSNVYGSVLPFNVRLAIQNKSQQLVANSRVSKGARSMAKKLSEADAKELEGGLVFGDSTVYGQLEDVNALPTGKGKGVIEKVKKVDPYQRSEHTNVITSYHKGAMQAVKDSQVYKDAKASGQKTPDAIHTALQDPEVKAAAMRRGNVVVNDTQFGASPIARPEMLREEGSLWGILPKKTIYMFTRFPIGMSQHALEVLDNKSTRALEMLKNGDPRTVPIAEMRTNYHALLDSMKDAQKAVKGGTDVGIPEDVLNQQIKAVSDNLKIIDAKTKKLSQIRGGKTVKNLGKMWAAAAAIQIIFDGGIQSFADDPAGTTMEAVNKTNPTMGNRVVGEYSPLAAITSSASPIDRYGKPNERAIANYIPGVGLAVNRGRDIKKLYESLTGAPTQ